MKTVIAISAVLSTAVAFVPGTSQRKAFKLASTTTDSFTKAEKDMIIENVFECHGFFPDMRDESELPAEVVAMRDQPKPSYELSAIKAKYASMNEADAAYAILLDLGLMEDYDKLGDYSDDFADDAM